MNIEQIRSRFPILSTKVYGKDLVYLDNAATAQRPEAVLEAINALVHGSNANIHRAVHALSSKATEAYELTREAVRAYLNAEQTSEIVFTSGTTASINLVAFSFGEAFVNEGDEVIVSVAEHHSNIVPWQMMCERRMASLKVLDIDENGELKVDELEKLISERTKIVAIAQISNVLGVVNPVRKIVQICHAHGVPVLVDGAQGVVHCPLDVKATDCDFYAFSGHKMYAATGVGVLYGKEEWLDRMPPYMGGGEMIQSVSFGGTTYAAAPHKFEAGTQNFNAVPTLVPAIDFCREALSDQELIKDQEEVKKYVLDALNAIPGLKLFGVPRRTEDKISLFSFAIEGVHHEDLALLLDKMGVAVRSGQMCAEPLMDRLGVTGLVRASFAPYNGMEDAKRFTEALRRAINMLV